MGRIRAKWKRRRRGVGEQDTKTDLEGLSGRVRRMSLAGRRTRTWLEHACSPAYPLSQTWWKTLHLSVRLRLKDKTRKGTQKGRTRWVDLFMGDRNISFILVRSSNYTKRSINVWDVPTCALKSALMWKYLPNKAIFAEACTPQRQVESIYQRPSAHPCRQTDTRGAPENFSPSLFLQHTVIVVTRAPKVKRGNEKMVAASVNNWKCVIRSLQSWEFKCSG